MKSTYRANTTSNATVKSENVILLIFPPAENSLFLLVEATVCAGSVTKRQAEDEQTKVIVQSTYTSAIKRSTIVMNGRDSNVSTHGAIRFTVVM